MAIVDVTTEIEIALPREQVAEFVSDPNNVPDWHENIKSVEWGSDSIVSLGSQIAFEASFMGREFSYTYEIVEFVQHEKLVMKTAEGPFPMETSYLWESLDESLTKMTLRNCGEPTGIPSMMVSLVAKMLKQSNQSDLELLKEILEEYQ